jgi:phenylalanyl-tRNA synthetase beta chain
MKFTLNWLKDYLNTDAPSHVTTGAIIEKLTDLGLEVEEVENSAETYAPFTVAKVISAEQHPDADRLRVCQVETDKGMVQVICGAPNARAGMTAIFAPVGAYIPGLDVTLEKGKIRGQDSNGMLVSMREMKLSDEHDGIIDLEDDHAIGTAITDIFDGLDDVAIEIGLTPDRADCAGILGIARDLSAGGCGQFTLPVRPKIDEKFKSAVDVHTHTPDTCPHFVGRQIKVVKNGESPDWLKAKLESIGLRPISILVDITNYFCIGLNRPLHVYDIAKLNGDIIVQIAKGGEKFDALNDKSYELTGGETVICDDNGVLGLGGIVGGTSTGCDENTTDVFLECAYFDPTSTAVTGRKHQVITDARYRFERGVDPDFLPHAIDLATQMILDLCGGEASEVVVAGEPINWHRTYDFDPAMTQRLTGVDIDKQEQLYILGSLGFEIDGDAAPYTVQAPSWRPDILGSADLVEEIIRVYGYDKIKPLPVTRTTQLTENALSSTHTLRTYAGRTLANCGMQECITWSFMPYDLARDFNGGIDVDNALRLTNAISVEMDTMRPSILPNLIQAAAKNADRGYPNAALFETGPVFHGVNPDDQMTVASGVRHGVQSNKHWANADISRAVNAYDAKSDAMAVITSINPSLKPQISTTDAPSHYHPGRSGVFRLGKNILATFGEIHPAILDDIDIVGTVVGFEVFLDRIPQSKKSTAARPPLNLSAFQPITRDFAFIVSDDVQADSLIAACAKGGGKLVSNVQIFDVYQGQGVDDGHKSIALSVQFLPVENTLKDKEIEELCASIISKVTSKTGATLRG